jgi:hypothetical protein
MKSGEIEEDPLQDCGNQSISYTQSATAQNHMSIVTTSPSSSLTDLTDNPLKYQKPHQPRHTVRSQ